jgi:hypothetical protein
MQFFTSLFSPNKPLSPVERWEKMSATSPRDNSIKSVALEVLHKGSWVGVGASIVVPLIWLHIGTGGLSLAIGAVALGVFGLLSSKLGISQSSRLKNKWDWTDYSDKTTMLTDCERITKLSLSQLNSTPASPLLRLDNMRKYGVISSGSAGKLQNIFDRYINTKKIANQLAFANPAFKSVHDDFPVLSNVQKKLYVNYREAKENLKMIKTEWKGLQNDLLVDLSTFN